MANEYLIQRATLVGIADGVRDISGETENLSPVQMTTELGNAGDEVDDQNGILQTLIQTIESKQKGEPDLIEKTVNANGTYTATDDNADGYSQVVVSVSGGGGDDGYLRIGGRIFYDTYSDYGDNGATYQFFDATKTEITYTGDIDDLEYAVYYKVTGVPKFDRFYVFDNTSHGSEDYAAVDGIVRSVVWGMLEVLTQHNIWDNDPDFCNKIGSGKALSALTLARCEEEQHYDDYGGVPTIWQYINHCNATRLNGCGDWFILSRGEHDALRDSGLVSWYQRGATPMDNLFLWSSVEYDGIDAWYWRSDVRSWGGAIKYNFISCFAARAF